MVSVCMATYNGELYIKEQIDSILCQLNVDDEIIISDDGSTDGTIKIIKSYNDERIKLYKHDKKDYSSIKYSRNFYYATDNFENAIRMSKGEYIFLADQDDIWLPNKIKMMIEAMSDCNCVISNYNIIDSDGNCIKENCFNNLKLYNGFCKNLITTPFLGCLMAFKRNTLSYILPFPPKLIAHDLWIGCLSSKKNDIKFLPEVLVKHRKHNSNTSNVTVKSSNPLFWKIAYRIKLLFQLIMRG